KLGHLPGTVGPARRQRHRQLPEADPDRQPGAHADPARVLRDHRWPECIWLYRHHHRADPDRDAAGLHRHLPRLLPARLRPQAGNAETAADAATLNMPQPRPITDTEGIPWLS